MNEKIINSELNLEDLENVNGGVRFVGMPMPNPVITYKMAKKLYSIIKGWFK